MEINNIIIKKRKKIEMTKEEIDFFIEGYTNGTIPDYQAAALIMAIAINGLTDKELINLTFAMAKSGDRVEDDFIKENVVDKHSSGGVGDKVTLILMPLISSLGIPVAKMSGRGLGITGGTIDKLEAIPGYKTDLSIKDFVNKVKTVGISINGQTDNFVPADKKIYSLRDVIECTDSIPLIASSIMSKKIAAGTSKVILDVTFGSGAFMKKEDDAIKLSKTMSKIAKAADINLICVITKMDEPIGKCIGNSLEVIEAVQALKGNMTDDLKEVVLELGAEAIKLAGKGNNIEKNKKILIENIENQKGYEMLIKLVNAQDGDIEYIKDVSKFKKSKYIFPVIAPKDGIVQRIDANICGTVSSYLGAGRQHKEDKIDASVGIVIAKKSGEKVQKGDILAYVNANDEKKVNIALDNLSKAFEIGNRRVRKESKIIGII